MLTQEADGMRWISVEWRCREMVEAIDPVVILFQVIG
jgi:hypothetical protein